MCYVFKKIKLNKKGKKKKTAASSDEALQVHLHSDHVDTQECKEDTNGHTCFKLWLLQQLGLVETSCAWYKKICFSKNILALV